jgi:DNA-binding CsgD family transcriptional regulator
VCRRLGNDSVTVTGLAPPKWHLSPRQVETLQHLLAGRSEKEVAIALGRSVHTVHVYVKEIYGRFGVQSRAELLARFVPVLPTPLLVELIRGGRLQSRPATVGVWMWLCAGTGRSASGHSGGDGRSPPDATPSPPEGAVALTRRRSQGADGRGAVVCGRRSRPNRCRRFSSSMT